MRRRFALTFAATTVLLAVAASTSAHARDLTVSVRGNHLVDAAGHAIRLLGVDRSGTEYACSEGWGFTDSPSPAKPDSKAMIAAIRSWGANAVRVPLNEACWLRVNGVKRRWGGSSYRRKVTTYVHRLEAAGIHPILDLHVVDPGSYAADHTVNGLRPMPDAQHSIPFWRSLAKRFGHDRAVVFDLYNEPNDVGWHCLRDGCEITKDNYSSDVPHYRAVGTQRLVHVIRKAGAKNVIMVPGIDWTSDLSRWARFRPHDPLRRIAASLHDYEAPLGGCRGACLTKVLAPLAKRFPIVTGEMGDTDCNHDFIDGFMSFADQHGISYLGWGWDATKYGSWDCSNGPALVVDYAGKPTAYGVGLRDHLLALAGWLTAPLAGRRQTTPRLTSRDRTTCERVRTTSPLRWKSMISRSRSALSAVRTRAIASASPVTLHASTTSGWSRSVRATSSSVVPGW